MPKVELKKGRKKKEVLFIDENPKGQKEVVKAPIPKTLPLKPKSNITIWEWLLKKKLSKRKDSSHA